MLLSAAALGGTVAAQDNSTATETEHDDGPDLAADTNEPVDSQTTIVGFEYESGTFKIGVHAEEPTVLTLTEAVQFTEGAGQMSIVQQAVPSGYSTVTIDVSERGGQAAVVITTAKGLSQGRGTYVSTGQTQPTRPPVEYQTAAILAALAALGAGYYSYQRGKSKIEESDEPEVERIA